MSAPRMTWAAAVMGWSGLLAQQLLLRELLIVFAGNELTIGLILASWLATEAAGSIWARRSRVGGSLDATQTSESTAPVALYIRITLLFCASLFPAIYAVRLIKPVLGISVGTVAGLGTAAAASLAIVAPVSLTHGAMFTLGYAVSSRAAIPSRGSAAQPEAAHIYIMETVGTLVAGLLWTAVLIRLSDPFQVATAIVVLNALVMLHLAGRLDAGRARWTRAGWALVAACLLATAAFALTAAGGGTGALQRLSLDALWRNQNVVHYENTMHGNIVITENQGQHTVFTDGTPAFLVPVPDTGLVEPLVHIPLAAHRRPERVLLVGGGMSGFLEAILRHPSVTRVDYLEIDPRLLQIERDLAAAAGERAVGDPRVRLHATDPRVWLRSQAARYDIIFSRDHDPDNLHSSRSFSEEFFRLAADHLTDDGVLVLGFPGLVGHLNEPLQNLAAGVHHSLQRVFPAVRAFPGDSQSFLIASSDPAIVEFGIDDFVDRLRERGMLDAIALPWHVEQRLHPRWHAWFQQFVAAGSSRPIRDFQPRALFLGVAYWSSLNAPTTARMLSAIYALDPFLIVGAVVAVLLLPAAALNRFSPNRTAMVIPAVLATGFAAMVVNLSLLFAFQIVAGRLFGWLGLLAAGFISGLGLGARSSNRLLRRADGVKAATRLLIRTDAAVLLFTTLLLILLPLTAPAIVAVIEPSVIRVLFFPLLLASGAVCGAQFPVACGVLERAAGDRAAHRHSGADPSGADPAGSGLVYAADLVGGCIGGIIGGIVLLPLLGLAGAGLAVGLVKAITAGLLLRAPGIAMEAS